MVLPDVNVLVHAHREDSPSHKDCKRWLMGVLEGQEGYAISELVLSGFLRVVTHARVFNPPTPLRNALEFMEVVKTQPHCSLVSPGARHWKIFTGLCKSAAAKGNLIPDAYFAALAIETGCEWVTTDRDFARFPGLKWRDPR